MEGVAFGLRDALDLMSHAGLAEVDQIRGSGGGTASPLWRQILADVLEADIVAVNTEEGAAFGAALLAAVGTGSHTTVADATTAWIRETARTNRSGRSYREHHRLFTRQYEILKPTFDSQTDLTTNDH